MMMMMMMMMTIEEFNGPAPSVEELAAAPLVKRWELRQPKGRVDVDAPSIRGYFYGHPDVSDGSYTESSTVLRIDTAKPPQWAQAENRLYRLGRPIGKTERHIREIAEQGMVAVWRKRISKEELMEFRRLTGIKRLRKLDDVERLLLVLVRADQIDEQRARDLHKLLVREIFV